MKPHFLLGLAAACGLAACASREDPVESSEPKPTAADAMRMADAELQTRLSPAWLGEAERIHTGYRTIYYQGEAIPAKGGPKKHWEGIIRGDILVLTPSHSVTCTGEVQIGPDDEVRVKGRNSLKMVMEGEAPWQHLLEP